MRGLESARGPVGDWALDEFGRAFGEGSADGGEEVEGGDGGGRRAGRGA